MWLAGQVPGPPEPLGVPVILGASVASRGSASPRQLRAEASFDAVALGLLLGSSTYGLSAFGKRQTVCEVFGAGESEEVHLADVHAQVTQNGVGRRRVEEEMRKHISLKIGEGG